jgi:Piwi domain
VECAGRHDMPAIVYANADRVSPDDAKGSWLPVDKRPSNRPLISINPAFFVEQSFSASAYYQAEFTKNLINRGLTVGRLNYEVTVSQNDSVAHLKTKIDAAKKVGANLAVLVLIRKSPGSFLYSRFKRAADVECGIESTCVTGRNPNKQNEVPAYMSSVAMKVNLKFPGTTDHCVDQLMAPPRTPGDVQDEIEEAKEKEMEKEEEKRTLHQTLGLDKTIILGADVTHCGGALPGTPSICAVVGSIEQNFTQYRGSMKLQQYDPNKQSEEVSIKLH